MVTARKSLMSLTAADLMTDTLVAIPQKMSLQAAARLMMVHQISGAPVVDERGVCVGVISAMDFMRWAEKGRRSARQARPGIPEYCQTWQIVEPENLPVEEVSEFMTATVVTVPPSVRISELARMMVDAHIHRVIVVDEEGRPKGIVSSTDILAAVAYANPASGPAEAEKGADV